MGADPLECHAISADAISADAMRSRQMGADPLECHVIPGHLNDQCPLGGKRAVDFRMDGRVGKR